MFVARWAELPEVEVMPNNFRRSVAGLEVGINQVHWVHPAGTPAHTHDDAEKAILVVEGSMEWFIGPERSVLSAGSVAVVPRGVEHWGRTAGEDALFFEAFAPARIQNLIGFLGHGVLPHAEIQGAEGKTV